MGIFFSRHHDEPVEHHEPVVTSPTDVVHKPEDNYIGNIDLTGNGHTMFKSGGPGTNHINKVSAGAGTTVTFAL